MEQIPEVLVEQTWQEVGNFTAARADREMQKLGKEQPDLLAFILEVTKDLDQDAKELGIYLFFNVVRMFHKASPKKIAAVSSEAILECFEKNGALLESLEGAPQTLFKRMAEEVSGQPYVTGYVVKAIFEEPDEEDPLDLDDEDVAYLFMVLKTVIDVLNEVTTS